MACCGFRGTGVRVRVNVLAPVCVYVLCVLCVCLLVFAKLVAHSTSLPKLLHEAHLFFVCVSVLPIVFVYACTRQAHV